MHADFALVRGYKADTNGNVIFRGTANNYNQIIAKAAKNVVVEVGSFGISTDWDQR